MRDYVLMTDSCCDLSASLAEELGIFVLPLSLELSGQTAEAEEENVENARETFE